MYILFIIYGMSTLQEIDCDKSVFSAAIDAKHSQIKHLLEVKNKRLELNKCLNLRYYSIALSIIVVLGSIYSIFIFSPIGKKILINIIPNISFKDLLIIRITLILLFFIISFFIGILVTRLRNKKLQNKLQNNRINKTIKKHRTDVKKYIKDMLYNFLCFSYLFKSKLVNIWIENNFLGTVSKKELEEGLRELRIELTQKKCYSGYLKDLFGLITSFYEKKSL